MGKQARLRKARGEHRLRERHNGSWSAWMLTLCVFLALGEMLTPLWIFGLALFFALFPIVGYLSLGVAAASIVYVVAVDRDTDCFFL